MAADPCGGGGKRGPLSIAEFTALWSSVTDPGYSRPFIELGEGRGFEAHTQSFAQHARVSLAVDRTTQAMYVLPFSGQSNEPASGGAKSTVELTFSRTAPFTQELTLAAGLEVEEVQIDFGEHGGVEVHTGRRYQLLETVGIGPGQPGPVVVTAQAVAEGRGFNNPAPGTLQSVLQPASAFANDRASIVPGLTSHRLVVQPEPDVVTVEHVGQYVLIAAGANAGQVRRIVGYVEPTVDPIAPNGGTAILAATMVLRLAAVSGAFIPGEIVEQVAGGKARVLYQTPTHLVADRLEGTMGTGLLTAGVVSGVIAVFDGIDQAPDMVAEANTAAWRILDWVNDLGLAVTNLSSPAGGRAAMLDEIGDERSVLRGAGQDDDTYRESVSTLADVVSPNAVRRAINRVLAPYGVAGSLREVGSARLQGLFFDGDTSSTDPFDAFAYDMDFTARPADRFKLAFSYDEFRGFFLVGVPPLGLGEFGCAYDAGPCNAYDAAPFLAFHDGFALTTAAVYRTLWQRLNEVKAGGVGFDIYVEDRDRV